MPVLPEEISASVLRKRLRGYDRQQVAGLLERVAADYAGAIERIGVEAHERAQAQATRRDVETRLAALTDAARANAEQVRHDADAQADAVRARAERAAALIITQAEEAAAACERHTESLRAAAQHDSDAARARLENADQRARQLEEAARARWEALRTETENGFDQLRIAERRFAERVRRAETALSGLRSNISLLDQVHHAEGILAELRPAAQHDDQYNGNQQQ